MLCFVSFFFFSQRSRARNPNHEHGGNRNYGRLLGPQLAQRRVGRRCCMTAPFYCPEVGSEESVRGVPAVTMVPEIRFSEE